MRGPRLIQPRLKGFIAGAAIVAFLVGGGFAHAQSVSDEDTPAGTLSATTSDKTVVQFPLKHTSVKAEISGYVVETEVTQQYINPFKQPLEAVYVFPLPNNAAVYEMEMHVGSRVIKGEIKRRAEAKAIYEAAKAAGQRASLLEQERPNIFTQSVANVMPGDNITVVIRYTETLAFDKDHYSFVFPMVVGPRYIPGDWAAKNENKLVSDFERVTPPLIAKGFRSGHDIDVTLKLDTGKLKIADLRSTSHQIRVTRPSDSVAEVTLAPGDTIPNKDFVLNYVLAGDRPQATLFTYRPDASGEGYFSLMIQPQAKVTPSMIAPKEIFFLVDASGSMSGEPIAKMKEVMNYALDNLNPKDTFYIAVFNDHMERLDSKPRLATTDNVVAGKQFVSRFQGGGGTQMLPGILETLDFPRDDQKLRLAIVMTDGMIGNDNEVLDAVKAKLGNGRVFSFGIGSSPNRHLIDSLARLGRGSSYYVNVDEKAVAPVTEFYDRIRSPLMTDLKLDWGGADVSDVYPALLPDLFAGQPLYIHGRYKPTAKPVTLKVSGKVMEKTLTTLTLSMSAPLPAQAIADSWVGRVWAHAKIADLTDSMLGRQDSDTVEQITILGLRHKLLTAYTSFVAVEQVVANKEGKTTRVDVPTELPAGMNYEGLVGSSAAPTPVAQAMPSNTNYAPSPSVSYGSSNRGLVDSESMGLAAANEGLGIGQKDTRTTVGKAIGALMALLGVIAAVITLIGGFKWLAAGKELEKAKKARRLFRAGLIGLGIIFTAYAVVIFVINSIINGTN